MQVGTIRLVFMMKLPIFFAVFLFALSSIAFTESATAVTLGKALEGKSRAPASVSPHKLKADALFGSYEFSSNSLSGLPQWLGVLGRFRELRSSFEACGRDAQQCSGTVLTHWRRILDQARAIKTRGEQLKLVNASFNHWPYKTDRIVYGVSEYWATPKEFIINSGDCEDYAIAKYFMLRALGIPTSSLRIVVLWDRIRGVGHAILAYYTGNSILLLDNLTAFVISHKRFKHYVPQYSMNEEKRWAHVDQNGQSLLRKFRKPRKTPRRRRAAS